MLGNILAVGLMSMGMGLSGVKDEPKMYAQDDATYTITYNANDWKEKAQTIYNWLETEGYVFSNKLTATGTINVNSANETISNIYSSTAGTDHMIYVVGQSGNHVYYVESQDWYSSSHSQETITELEITSQTYYEALAEEPNMGSDIVGTIASGLGIIGALATTFLTGFGNLFYSSGALTPFAIFTLVMLGIAVSFAVVKLVLNLIRSNTGA